MARIMSAVMAVFIVVPAIAPALGQAILLITGWRAVFGVLMAQGLFALTSVCHPAAGNIARRTSPSSFRHTGGDGGDGGLHQPPCLGLDPGVRIDIRRAFSVP